MDLASMEGWAMLAWTQESSPHLERASDGYVAQEWQSRLS